MKNKITIVRYKIVQSLWATAGIIALLLGTLGVFLPLLPTTPFILLASICCAKSSERLFDVLVIRRPWGKYLLSMISGKGISFREKIGSIAYIWATILLTVYLTDFKWISIMLIPVAVGVTVHLLRMPRR
jgi:uncharacterized membrane protein YbaN (DUF454 family)